jgi:CrcB protein
VLYFWIALGGAMGAVGRYGLQGLVYRFAGAAFPYGTLVVNVTGCFLIGWIMAVAEGRFVLSPTVRVFLTIGILGGFTTFSSFAYETLALMRDGEWVWALANAAGSVVLGLVAAFLGMAIGRLL